MKKIIVVGIIVGLFSVNVFAEGGFWSLAANLCLDPRAGYMINDKDDTWVGPVVVTLLTTNFGLGVYACIESGVVAGLGAVFLPMTSTGWVQFKKYKIREREWMRLVPIYGIIVHIEDAIEASRGVKWSEIVEREKLAK